MSTDIWTIASKPISANKSHKVIISQNIVVNRPIKRKYMPNSSSAENRGCLLKTLSIQGDYPGIYALITKEIRSTSAYQWAWCLKWIMRSSPLASFQWSKMVMRPDLGSCPSFMSHINIKLAVVSIKSHAVLLSSSLGTLTEIIELTAEIIIVLTNRSFL